MKIAIVGAGFTPSEADQLRRSLAAFRRMGDIAKFRDRFVQGMVENGYEQDFAERCFKQIEGFADYGFPESHAASFALLVYVSAWLKCHYPAAFAAALLNSQPMGFYAPAQIVRDAREHGVEVRPVDVNRSRWDCTLEPGEDGMEALRLGFRQVKGLSENDMHRLVAARLFPYRDMADVARRAGLDRAALEKLARADAFRSLKLDRRAALWAVKGLEETPLPLFAGSGGGRPEPEVDLPGMCLGEQVADDYRATSLSLRGHPVGLLRPWLAPDGYQPAVRLRHLQQGDRFRVAGVVTARQRPGSARGVMFVTLEDETGIANLIVWPHVMERFRRQAVGAALLGATGEVQREGRVIHVLAEELADLTPLLGHLDQATGVPFPHGPMRPGGDEMRAAEPASRLRFPSRDFR